MRIRKTRDRDTRTNYQQGGSEIKSRTPADDKRMENTDKSQGGSDIYRIRKLPKKTRTRTSRRNEDPYTTNEKRTKMTMGTTRGESVSENQETNIGITINTTFRFEPLVDYGNGRLESHDRNSIISGKQITGVHVKKDDSYGTELRDHEKRNACHRTRD